MRYYEDIADGESFEHGSQTVGRAEIISYAEEYDPQPFHVDETHAKQTMFNGLIASGLHTLSLCNCLAIDGVLEDLAILGGRGIDDLRFHEPVYPGDTLSIQATILTKRDFDAERGRGDVDIRITGFDEQGTKKISWVALTMMAGRHTESAD